MIPIHSVFNLSGIAKALFATGLLIPYSLTHAQIHHAQLYEVQLDHQQKLQAQHLHRDHVLGTSLDLIVMSTNPQSANLAIQAIQQEIDRLDQILSTYRADSEISQLNQRSSMQVSTDLFHVIQVAEQLKIQSQNAFSPRLGEMLDIWQQASQSAQLPDAQQLLQHAQELAQSTVTLDQENHHIDKPATLQFAIDAIAKGYIIDQAVAAAQKASPDIQGVLVDIGGDVRCWGQSPRQNAWQVGVNQSNIDNALFEQVLQLNDQAVAHSGSGARDIQVAGCHYAHTISPEDGQPVAYARHTTVVAPTAMQADGLATALSVMSAEQGLTWVNQLNDVEAQWITENGQQVSSDGWQALVQKRIATYIPESVSNSASSNIYQTANLQTVAGGTTSSKAGWPKDFALNLNFDVPRIQANPYRAPYINLWITDEKRNLVKNILIQGKSPKWLESNFVWWKRYGRRLTQQDIDTQARTSRPPGNYNVVWDGTDENGEKVAPGKYILHYEASREHGGHSYESLPLSLESRALEEQIAATGELGLLKIRFGKRAN